MARKNLSRQDSLERLKILLEQLRSCVASSTSTLGFKQVVGTFLLTEENTSYMLHVSVKTLQAWRLEGRGPRYRKLSKAVRYKLSDILEFIEEAGRHSTSEAA